MSPRSPEQYTALVQATLKVEANTVVDQFFLSVLEGRTIETPWRARRGILGK